MNRYFVIVIPEADGRFEIGLADGIYPWKHLATCYQLDEANRVGTHLAMHYRVRLYGVSASEALASAEPNRKDEEST